MFITNLTNARLGVNGIINLAPREVNRYIDNNDADLVARVLRLESAKLVSVVREEGLEKTGIPAKVNKVVTPKATTTKTETASAAADSKEAIPEKQEVKTTTRRASRATKENTEVAGE